MPKASQSNLIIQDGLNNSKTGIGTARDKSQAVNFTPDHLDPMSARIIYYANDLAARIVDLPAKEMTRRGWEVKVPKDKTLAKKINALLSDLKVKAKLADALRKKRAMGGALILINVTDGETDAKKPINLAKLQSVDSLTVFEPGEASALTYWGNPVKGEYAEPASWNISPRVINADSPVSNLFVGGVHASRCFRISDAMLSRLDTALNFGFAESIISRVWRTIARVDQNYASTGSLIDDFAQAVFKIKGLYKSLINDAGKGAKARLKLIDEYRSTLRGIVLDADGEDFARQPTPVTGLSDLIDRFAARLAAAADMPLSVLFGKSPSGLAASGDMDVRMWYDSIAGAQELEIEPFLSYLLSLIFASKLGPTRGKVPEDWEIYFRPLWQPTEKEKADVRYQDAQTRQIYNDIGALDSEQISGLIENEMGLDADDDETDAEDLGNDEGTTTGVDPEGNPIMTPNGKTPGPQGQNVQQQALNGTQITSLVEVISSVLTQKISRDSGIQILMLAFQLDLEAATKLLGDPNFKPKEEPAPPAPSFNRPPVPPAGG